MSEALQMKSDNPPLVTVAMPIYNAGKDLRLAVLSIIKQTFMDWELIIIDDGSTDTALEGIADIDDTRINIIRDGENKGLAARLNQAIDLARGQYFARMDQDDISYPDRFERQIETLQKNPELDLVATRAITIDANDQITGLLPYSISHEEICARPWRGFYFPHPTWLGRIEWFRMHGYTVPGPYFCEDQDLLLRSYDNSRFKTICEPLFAYRVRHGINWCKLIKTRLSVLQAQWRNFIPKRQIIFALLALLTFFGRIISDLFEAAFWKINLHNTQGYKEISRKWNNTLNFVREGARNWPRV